MKYREVKNLLTGKLKWNVTDVHCLTTDKDQFSYYLVYRNHKIRCICAIDELNGCVSGIWSLGKEEIKNMNKRIKSIIATVTVLVLGAFSLGCLHAEEVKAFDQCSGTYKTYTSEMNKKTIKIKESKLTSLRYLKKICQITDTYKGEDCTVYELDGGKGRFIKYKGGHKVCLLVKDGELYGRWAELSQRGAALTYNLHDKSCHQRTHSESYGNWTYTYYFSTDALEHNAEILKTRMIRLSETWGLNN